MRDGMACVLEVLRGEAGHRPVDETEWAAALALAQHEHVLPLVAARLLETQIPLPEPIQLKLTQARREAVLVAFFWASELTGLLRDFAAAGIDVILLKGPSLAERIYGTAGGAGGTALRLSRDLDLLVRKPDYAAAESLLTRTGFLPAGRSDDYHRQWRRATATVELHFDIENPLAIDFAIATAWASSIPSDFHGQPCRQLAPADELLFLCIHGVRHRFERLSLVVDIALALERLPLGTARREVASLDRLRVLGVAMASHLQPVPASHPLADRLWQDLMTAPQPTLDWQSQHAFFLETEPTPTRRLLRRIAHLRIASTRLIDLDYDYAARFGLQSPWQVWLLRPARLLFARKRG